MYINFSFLPLRFATGEWETNSSGSLMVLGEGTVSDASLLDAFGERWKKQKQITLNIKQGGLRVSLHGLASSCRRQSQRFTGSLTCWSVSELTWHCENLQRFIGSGWRWWNWKVIGRISILFKFLRIFFLFVSTCFQGPCFRLWSLDNLPGSKTFAKSRFMDVIVSLASNHCFSDRI